MKTKKLEYRKRRQCKQTMTRIGWIGATLALVAVLGYALSIGARPAKGESIPVMPDTSHVEEGTDPGPYNSDPPTSGKHYPDELDAGFYDENTYAYPAGYLVHNLEHGYIIFWYDCGEFAEGSCDELKAEIRQVLEAENNNKVIAYPWESIDEPVVLTSWGQMLRMDKFDAQAARDFVISNRNKAPEPNAP